LYQIRDGLAIVAARRKSPGDHKMTIHCEGLMSRENTKSIPPANNGVLPDETASARVIRPARMLTVLALIFPLAACDTTNYAAKAEANTPMAPAAPTDIMTGSRLTLRVPLNLPAGGAPLLFQSNAIVTRAQLTKQAPFCRFATASPNVPRTLKPITFTVSNIDYDDRSTSAGGKPVSVTHFRLLSDPKHAGYVLSCQWPEGAPALAFVTTDEVQATVSAFFTLGAVN